MRIRMAGLTLAVVLGVSAVVAPSVAAEAMVNGWLEVRGERALLTQAFAAMETDRLEPGDRENVVILLSDKPVPEELRSATKDYTTWAGEQARAGQLAGVVIVIDPETKVWSRGQRLSKEHGLTFYMHTSTAPDGRKLRYEPAESGPGEIAGRVSMTEPMQGVDESDGPWQVDAEFRVAVVRQPPITARMTGPDAQKSPQYKAVMAFLNACKRKDLEAIKKAMDADSQAMLAEMVAQQGRSGTLKMLSEMAAESLKMKTAEVVVRGSRAEVRLGKTDRNSKEQYTLTVALDQGVWKMSR